MRLYVARRAPRKAMYLPMEAVSNNPSLLFPMTRGTEQSQLEELVRAELEKQGITEESKVHQIVDEAEKQYEERIKVGEARREIRRLMEIRANGGKLMSVGPKKWRQAFYMGTKKPKG